MRAGIVLVAALMLGCGTEVHCVTDENGTVATALPAWCGANMSGGDFAICGETRLLVERTEGLGGAPGRPHCGLLAASAMCGEGGEVYCADGSDPVCFSPPETTEDECLSLLLDCEREHGFGARCAAALTGDGDVGPLTLR